MMKVTEHVLVIESQLDQVGKARQWAAKLARKAGFDNEAVFALELALSEALANVIRHAYQGAGNREIRLSLAFDDEKLRLAIRDFGKKFDLTNYRPPDLSRPHEGGYGIYLMHELMDEVHYDTSQRHGTTLTLVRYRSHQRGRS